MIVESFPDRTSNLIYERARATLERIKPGIKADLSPSSAYCTIVNQAATQVLKESGSKVEYLENESFCVVRHAFVHKPGLIRQIYDWQYLQFVDIQLRSSLPDYMIVTFSPVSPKKEVIKGLNHHHIPEKYHARWLEELFWDK